MAGWTCSDNDLIRWDGTIKARRLIGALAPITDDEAASKLYVDSQIQGENHWDMDGGATLLYPHVAGIKLQASAAFISGNVGIGIANPGSKLSVAGNIHLTESNPIIYMRNYRGIETAGTTLIFGGQSTAAGYSDIYFNSWNGSASIPRIVLNGTAGNVGIGTTSPGAKLAIHDTTGGVGSSILLRLVRDGGYGNTNFNQYYLNSGNFPYGLSMSVGTDAIFNIEKDAGGSGFTRAYFTNSNVGIGTTSPQYKLDVHTSNGFYNTRFYQPSAATDSYNTNVMTGAMTSAVGYMGIGGSTTGNTAFRDSFVIGTQSAHTLNLNTNDQARLTILSGGNVGIGTTSPDSLLHINSSTTAIFTLQSTQTANSELNITAGANNIDYKTIGINDVMSFSTYYGEKMRITPEGNVGIGTTSPSHLLDVASQAAITAFGGFATKFKLGAVASGGWIVRCSPASAGYVVPCGLADGFAGGQDMPIGVIYHTTPLTAVNSDVWVVTNGKAKVMLDGQAECSYGYFLRTSDTTSGAALASQNPNVPADASHWREIGHAYGHASGALVECILHFN